VRCTQFLLRYIIRKLLLYDLLMLEAWQLWLFIAISTTAQMHHALRPWISYWLTDLEPARDLSDEPGFLLLTTYMLDSPKQVQGYICESHYRDDS